MATSNERFPPKHGKEPNERQERRQRLQDENEERLQKVSRALDEVNELQPFWEAESYAELRQQLCELNRVHGLALTAGMTAHKAIRDHFAELVAEEVHRVKLKTYHDTCEEMLTGIPEVDEFARMLQRWDYYYHYSDDREVYNRGERQRGAIEQFMVTHPICRQQYDFYVQKQQQKSDTALKTSSLNNQGQS